MKVLAFSQLPYRHLPEGFESHYDSVVTMPYHELVDRKLMHKDHVDFLDELMHAARMGFDGLGTTEHSQNTYDILPNPNLQMASLAYATHSEGLKPALCCVGRSLAKTREPLRVAEEYGVIDQISGGRLIAGFPVALSYDANLNQGIPPIETRNRFAENRALIDKAWTSKEVFPWNGRYNKYPYVNLWPRPYQSPRPPVWSPAIGNPNTLGALIDNDDAFLYLSWFGPKKTGPRVFNRYWELVEEKGKALNPYRLAFMQCVAVANTDEEAHRLYGPHILNMFRTGLGSIPLPTLGLPGYVDIKGVEFLAKDPGDFGIVPRLRHIDYSEILDNQCVLVGSPATVKQQLLEMAKNFRIGNLVLTIQLGSMPPELSKMNIELLAKEVLPDLRKLWANDNWQHHWWPEGAA